MQTGKLTEGGRVPLSLPSPSPSPPLLLFVATCRRIDAHTTGVYP